MEIDPWGSSQYQDYARLREQFGIAPFGRAEWDTFDHPHRLLQRGVVFGHRDFDRISDAVKRKDPWALMTGLMPSGRMHLGHKMLVDQVVAHQESGADVHVAVADFEAVAARGFTIPEARELALDEYVRNYLALGLDPNKAEVYFQTKRHAVKDLAHQFALRVNWSHLTSLYGFSGETSMAHANAPIIQAADILHVQQMEPGSRPVLVPVGVDQDPHLRLTRDIAQAWRKYNLIVGDTVTLAVKGDKPQRWLDVAESVLDELGMGNRTGRKRNDKHGQIDLGSHLSGRDLRDLDLALARAEAKKGELGFVRPSATFHRFMTGLTGNKMSSSSPDSSVFLTDSVEEATTKVKRSVTGGRATAAEQREKGADPTKCPVYELFVYHLADDNQLETVHQECTTGARLCGGCKGEAIELLTDFLTQHKEKRDATEHLVNDIVSEA